MPKLAVVRRGSTLGLICLTATCSGCATSRRHAWIDRHTLVQSSAGSVQSVNTPSDHGPSSLDHVATEDVAASSRQAPVPCRLVTWNPAELANVAPSQSDSGPATLAQSAPLSDTQSSVVPVGDTAKCSGQSARGSNRHELADGAGAGSG